MFIHIGNDNILRTEEIISIIDVNLISSSTIMEEMLENGKKQGEKSNAKSIIITEDVIYFSALSVATLKKRTSMITTINKLDNYTDGLGLDNL